MAESKPTNGGVDPTASMMLHGCVAIVTGGAGGIGSAVSKHLASHGARVAVAYVGDPVPAQELVSGINSRHGGESETPRAIAVETDVLDAAQVKALFDAAAEAFGGELRILVTLAAVLDYSYAALAETSEATFDATLGVNRRAPSCAAARRLARDGRGRIVTFSSSGVASLRPGYSAYAASKAAVEMMTKILACELRGTGITANAVAPGSTGTPMFYTGKSEDEMEQYITEAPLGRLGMPEDIAPLVGFLASDAGHWVAQVVRCNGGSICSVWVLFFASLRL